jgi:hypothetical protein
MTSPSSYHELSECNQDCSACADTTLRHYECKRLERESTQTRPNSPPPLGEFGFFVNVYSALQNCESNGLHLPPIAYINGATYQSSVGSIKFKSEWITVRWSTHNGIEVLIYSDKECNTLITREFHRENTCVKFRNDPGDTTSRFYRSF